MHKFVWYPGDGRQTLNMSGAHLVGTDNVPVRAEFSAQGDVILCQTRSVDPVGLSLLWPVEDFGVVQLQTTRLPARERPYHLHVELARHQLMRISLKREEWGLYDYAGMDEIATQVDAARDAFVAALQQLDRPVQAARLADKALALGMHAAERMSRFHAEIFIGRRRQTGGFNKPFLGVAPPAAALTPAVAKQLATAFQFVRLPCIWREIQISENKCSYQHIDNAIKACTSAGMTVRGGPLLNFGVRSVPDWMYIWENDFEAIYEAAREHVERTVKRYAKSINSWTVVSGLHADCVFGFSFEQIMELTRMAATVTRQCAPRCQTLIDLSQPWGEYYARNQQTVPPLLYADMVVQSGISFDGFGLQFLFGIGSDGYHLRDLFQVSALIDKLANLGKPIHVTALGVPSQPVPAPANGMPPGGQWYAPWSEAIQAEWLSAAVEITLSKPYVDTVCLQPAFDADDAAIPTGGVLRADGSAKPAVGQLAALRERFIVGEKGVEQ